MYLVQHYKHPVYTRITKKVKVNIERALKLDAENPSTQFILKILRGATDNQYQATMVAFFDPHVTGKVLIGFAQFNYEAETDNDVNFNRREGLKRAIGRAKKYANHTAEQICLPSNVKKNFSDFIIRAKKYFKDKQFVQWAEDLSK